MRFFVFPKVVPFLDAPTYGSGGYYAESVAVGNVNGDGKPDLLVTNQCSDSAGMQHGFVGVVLGNGDGTFQPVVTYESGGYSAFSVTVWQRFLIIPYTEQTAYENARLWTDLQSAGKTIGAYDLIVAARRAACH